MTLIMPTRPKKTKKLETVDFEEIEDGDDWDLEVIQEEEPESPVLSKKYVGFNWPIYGVSAIGTFLVLWWTLK